jgi:DNA-directed RNA polymerase subunit RPC12/RpoP
MTKYVCGRCEAEFVSPDEPTECIMCEAICIYKVPFSFGKPLPVYQNDEGQKY